MITKIRIIIAEIQLQGLNIVELNHTTMHPSSFSILIVDDEKDILMLYNEIAKKVGCEVLCFTDPILAFEHYQQFPDKYSLIFTDMRMPRMSGIEFAKNIRELDSSVKIYLVTAFDTSDIQNQQDCIDARFDLVLEKPVDLLKLQQLIEQELSLSTK